MFTLIKCITSNLKFIYYFSFAFKLNVIQIFYTSLHDMYRLCGLGRAIRIGLGCVRACKRSILGAAKCL